MGRYMTAYKASFLWPSREFLMIAARGFFFAKVQIDAPRFGGQICFGAQHKRVRLFGAVLGAGATLVRIEPCRLTL
jgi:hypothetical protein